MCIRDSGNGDPYFRYFGERSGPPGKGYYSYDVGAWHAISLSSELYFEHGSRREVNAQEAWLRADLKAHPTLCTVAYFHRPLFTSGVDGPTLEMKRLWVILDQAGVDLVLNGHDHDYERFLPQTPDGVADSVRGIEQIVTGTGGGVLRRMRSPLARNSAYVIHGHFGVLKLSLGPAEYRRAFIDTDGRVWDPGGRQCH